MSVTEGAETKTKRSRRRWAWIPLGFLMLVVACLALPFVLVRFEGPRSWMLDQGPGKWLLDEGTRLRVERVERLDPGEARLRGVVLAARDSLGRWVPWARISRLSARWNVGDLLFGRYRIPSVEVESLGVALRDGVRPGIRAKTPDDDDQASGPAQAQVVSCGRLSVQHVDLWRNGEHVLEGALAFHRLEYNEGRLQVDLDTLGVKVHDGSGLPGGEELWAAFSKGGFWADPDGSMNVRNLSVEATGLEGRGWVIRSPHEEDSEWHISVRPRSLRPAQIARALQWDLPREIEPAPDDTLSGFLSLIIVPDTLEVRAELAGQWGGRSLDLKGMATRTQAGWDLPELRLRRRGGEAVVEGRADAGFTNLRGTVRLRNFDLKGGDIPWDAEPLGSTSLTGRLAFDLRRPRGEPWSLGYDIALNSSRVRSWSLGELHAAGTIDTSVVRVDSLRATLAGGVIGGSAVYEVASQKLDSEVDLRRVPCVALTERFVNPPLAGYVTGHVTVIGGEDRWRVRGWAEGENLLWDEISAELAKITDFDLSFPEMAGDGRLEVSELRAGPVRVSRGETRFGTSPQGLRVTGTAQVQGQSVAWTGFLTPESPGGVEFRTFRFEPSEGDAWSGDETFRVGWGPSGVTLENVKLSSPSGWIELDGALGPGDTVEGMIQAEVQIESVLEGWLDVPDSTRGVVRVDGTALGPLRDPKIDLEFGGESLLLLNWPIDDISGVLLWQEGRLKLDALSAEGPWGRAEIDSLSFTPRDSLSRVVARLNPPDFPWLGEVPLEALLYLRDVDLNWLAEKMSTDLAEPQALSYVDASTGSLESMIRVVRPEESIPGLRYAPRPEGYGDIDIYLGGALGRPRLQLSMVGRDLGYQWGRADTLSGRLGYEDGSLELEAFRWSTGERGGEITGLFPLDLSLAPPKMTIPADGDGMDFHIRVPQANIATLDPLSELLQEPRGQFTADLRVRGPVSEPVLQGSVDLSEGSLRIPLREERLREINGRLRMDSLGVHLENLKARIGKDGKVTASGRFRTLEDMDVGIKVRKGEFFETGVYRVVGDGDMRIFSKVDSISGENRPHVTGKATVREALILNIQPRESTGPPRPDPWIISVEVDAPSNISVNQSNARAQLGNGSFLVTRRDQWWNVAGSIDVQGGWYRVFNNQFAIQRGNLEFRDSGTGLDLVTDITAQTEVISRDQADPSQPVIITAHVTGPPDEMDVSLSSDPPYGDEEIYHLLSLGRLSTKEDRRAETGTFLLSEFVGQLEQELSEKSPLLQRVDVRQGEEGAYLVIQPLVTSQFNVNYAQELSFSPAQEVTLHYRLSNFLYLKAGVLHERVQDGTENEEYNLDLKFHIEYGEKRNDDKQGP